MIDMVGTILDRVARGESTEADAAALMNVIQVLLLRLACVQRAFEDCHIVLASLEKTAVAPGG